MRILVIYAHPVETSFCSALHARVVDTLRAGGHEVDDCDLYAEGFDPRLTREERLGYHDVPENRKPVCDHVDRLMSAEALVFVFPVWNYGFPAILKGYFDRVFLPGVSFRLEDGLVRPNLTHIKQITAVTTYGGTRLRAFVLGDAPRRIVKRLLRATSPGARVEYRALYDMNRNGPETLRKYLDSVGRMMERY